MATEPTPPYALAQINVAHALAPLDDPLLADFVAELSAINALAAASPGFLWTWTDDPPEWVDPKMLINLTLWRSVDDLADFTYRTAHGRIFKRRKAWFAPPTRAHMALWWVPAGHRPTLAEGFDKLSLLQSAGPSAGAFTFKTHFPPPA